ncbi:MAG: polyprenyl synthetase family protein [Burkholderiaceae bacterium]|nr:polyprenyl synthetase family protein [Burkholderiaceae bacterium]
MTEATTAAPPASAVPFDRWLAARGERAEQALERMLPPAGAHPARLHEAMRYAVLGGGKRVRPLLVYAAGEAGAAPAAALDCAACAVELVHAYSLVHDDLPCMDDDVLRRGRPTVHVQYGEALAMLVGDALQALAFEALAATAAHGAGASATAAMVAELARAAGSQGMAGGQAIDLASVGATLGREAIEDMHRRKTGALLRASVRLGGLCAADAGAAAADSHARRMQALDRYADAIGLAFQVVDDILDVEGDAATLGKTAGKDAKQSKPTYVTAVGLDAARRLAGQLREQAREAIAPLGEAGRRLAGLADLIVLRKS